MYTLLHVYNTYSRIDNEIPEVLITKKGKYENRRRIVLVSVVCAALAYPGYPKGPGVKGVICTGGQVPDSNGLCVDPDVTRDVFVYAAPPLEPTFGAPPPIPVPKVDYDVIFVHTPEQGKEPEPIVVPPPQQKTIVYVLTKNGHQEQQVIEFPAAEGEAPQVYYVNYNPGDNPTLAGDLKLQEILQRKGQQPGGGGGIPAGGYGPPPGY
ncbi:hypothetical protein Avbf_14803 [Armadillidium vulgare]|nr:hypothetical protein Avbf_14803 [Armadillidium vulgare]